MATGYGSVGRKPYRRGSRGGVAWSGGRTLRYDAPARKGWTHKARGMLGKVESNLQWVGLALGLLVPAEVCRAKHARSLSQYYIDDTIYETSSLFGARAGNPPLTQIVWKFTNPASTWTFAFWGSLVAQILTRLKVVSLVSARANTAIKKLTFGTLIASIFGGLFLGGGSAPTAPGNTTPNQDQFNRRNAPMPIATLRGYNIDMPIGGAF
jgi:hypothetical protein